MLLSFTYLFDGNRLIPVGHPCPGLLLLSVKFHKIIVLCCHGLISPSSLYCGDLFTLTKKIINVIVFYLPIGCKLTKTIWSSLSWLAFVGC